MKNISFTCYNRQEFIGIQRFLTRRGFHWDRGLLDRYLCHDGTLSPENILKYYQENMAGTYEPEYPCHIITSSKGIIFWRKFKDYQTALILKEYDSCRFLRPNKIRKILCSETVM